MSTQLDRADQVLIRMASFVTGMSGSIICVVHGKLPPFELLVCMQVEAGPGGDAQGVHCAAAGAFRTGAVYQVGHVTGLPLYMLHMQFSLLGYRLAGAVCHAIWHVSKGNGGVGGLCLLTGQGITCIMPSGLSELGLEFHII